MSTFTEEVNAYLDEWGWVPNYSAPHLDHPDARDIPLSDPTHPMGAAANEGRAIAIRLRAMEVYAMARAHAHDSKPKVGRLTRLREAWRGPKVGEFNPLISQGKRE